MDAAGLTRAACILQLEIAEWTGRTRQRAILRFVILPAISAIFTRLMTDLANALVVFCRVWIVSAVAASDAGATSVCRDNDVRVFATDLTTSSFTDGSSSWGHVSNGGDVQTRDTHTPPAGQVWQRDVPLATWPLGHCAQ